MADEKMVRVTAKRSYRKGPTIYGPGEVDMPESLATALGLHPDQLKAAAKKPTPKKGAAK